MWKKIVRRVQKSSIFPILIFKVYTFWVFFWAIRLIRIPIKRGYIATLFKYSRFARIWIAKNQTSSETGLFWNPREREDK